MTGGLHMTRRTWSALGLVASLAAMMAGAPAASAASGDACQLAANVDFGSTPLKSGSNNDTRFSLAGTLGSCQSNSGGPASATIELGKLYTDPVTQHQYREPAGSGSASCAAAGPSNWGGVAIVRWAGGGVSLIPLALTNFGPFTYVIGSPAQPSLQLDPVDPKDEPILLHTTAYAGTSSYGALALNFSPADCAGAGVGSASLSGLFGPVAFS